MPSSSDYRTLMFIKQLTIPAGNAFSNIYDTGGSVQPVKLYMPTTWTSAYILIYNDADNSLFQPDRDYDTNSLLLLNVSTSSNCPIPANYVYGIKKFRLVSVDSGGNPVNQAVDAVINVRLRPIL